MEKLKAMHTVNFKAFSLCGEKAEAQAIFMNTHTHTCIFNHSNYIPPLTPFIPCIHTLILTNNYTPILANGSAQDVQVNRRCLGQALEQIVDFFDVESHVGLPLPAAQH